MSLCVLCSLQCSTAGSCVAADATLVVNEVLLVVCSVNSQQLDIKGDYSSLILCNYSSLNSLPLFVPCRHKRNHELC